MQEIGSGNEGSNVFSLDNFKALTAMAGQEAKVESAPVNTSSNEVAFYQRRHTGIEASREIEVILRDARAILEPLRDRGLIHWDGDKPHSDSPPHGGSHIENLVRELHRLHGYSILVATEYVDKMFEPENVGTIQAMLSRLNIVRGLAEHVEEALEEHDARVRAYEADPSRWDAMFDPPLPISLYEWKRIEHATTIIEMAASYHVSLIERVLR